MDEREELMALRRLAALEAKAAGQAMPEEKPRATKGGSTLQFGPFDTGIPLSENVNNFLAGVGQNMYALGQGASQFLPGGATRQDVADRRKLDAELLDTKAGKAGSVLSNLLLAAVPGGQTLKGAAMIGGGLGLAQPSTSTAETVSNTLLGAGGGYVGKAAGDKVVQMIGGRRLVRDATQGTQNINVGPGQASASASITANPQATVRGGSTFGEIGDDVSAGLTEGQRNVLADGKRLGFKTTPGQESGSKVLQQFESKLEAQPVTSGRFFAIKDNNQRTLNRIAAQAIGEKSDDLSDAVIGRAYDRMESVFNSVADDIPRNINPDEFLVRLSGLEQKHDGLLPKGLADMPLVQRYINQVANGQTSGAQLNNLQSQLGKAAQNERLRDPALAQAYRDVQNLILDDIATGLTPQARKVFEDTRQQYGLFATLADNPSLLNPSNGNVSGVNLANRFQRKDRGFATGRNDSDLYNAARFAQAFKPIIGDSGTATRSPLNVLEAVASVPASIATRAYTSSPSISATNSLVNVMRNGAAPDLLSPNQANALMRLLSVGGGTAGAGSAPFLFGNPQ